MEIAVSEMCRVTFSIGKSYVCEVLCDVLDMDICHLILGRPWQFDVGAIHDGHENTYNFEWKQRKIRLLPCSTSDGDKELPDKSTMFVVTCQSLINSWKESSWMLALVASTNHADEGGGAKIPTTVRDILQCYKEVWPAALPNELPPL
ncbi:uncharacterized protein LOC110106910 [Dendrobium catenatum]|uniref:uncharacterized protein LOC110106910 n=1 Tax=Dendrobium catenatum TaxID=906689 RepID=UPI0009F50C1E|nr:uncharacterized protein LOC110106910 [Dendrobium catenatum]